jgi:hypothetical protein
VCMVGCTPVIIIGYIFYLISPGGGMVDTRDLKSREPKARAGSSPAPGTKITISSSGNKA